MPRLPAGVPGADGDRRRLPRADRDEGSPVGRPAVARSVAVAVAVRRRSAPASPTPLAGGDLPGEGIRAGGGRRVPVDGQVGQQRGLLALVVDAAGDEEDLAVPPGRGGLLVESREDDDLDRALEVLQRDDRHRRLGLGDDGPDAGHDAADDDALAVERLVAQVARVGGHEPPDLLGDLAHRVLRQVQPEQLLLPAQALADGDLGRGGERPLEGGGVGRAQVEQRGLARDPVALGRLRGGDRIVEPEQDLGRMAERAERADLGQRLEHLAVGQPQVDPGAEIGQRAERAALVAGGDDRLDRALADVLDREQAEPDGVALDGELEVAAMDVRAAGPRSHIRRHSATAAATFSSFERKAVRTAVM